MMSPPDDKVVRLPSPKVVQLHAARPSGASGDATINPKSIMQMSDLELHTYLVQLRERRMRAAKSIKQASAAKHSAPLMSQQGKMERKIAAAEKAMAAVDTALEKLEKLVKEVRAMQINYTNVDPT